MELPPACSLRTLAEARVFSGGPRPWAQDEHEHPEAQVTVHLPSSLAPTGPSQPRAAVVPCHAPHKGGGQAGKLSIVFHLSPYLLATTADEICGRANLQLCAGQISDPIVFRLAQAALAEMRSGGSHGSLLLDSIAHVLAGQLVRTHAYGLPDRQTAQSSLTIQRLSTLRDFIESRIDKSLTVRELAAVIGLGPQRLTALLKAATGFSPHAYLTHLRIIRAKQLLRNAELTLVEVALTLGFTGQSHFGAVFRSYMGLTPREYRKQIFSGRKATPLPPPPASRRTAGTVP